MESPHDVLGVEPDADADTIEEAYRSRVKQTHPDQGGSVRSFLMVRAAYERLREGEASEPDEEAAGAAERDPASDPTVTTVRYLDYDVLGDYGWTLADDDLFEKAERAGLAPPAFGQFAVETDGTLLEAAEDHGFTWPFACRGGACANCAVAVREGELSLPVNHILPEEMRERGIRLSCVGEPETGELRVVYNVKHLPDLDELRLPPRPFEAANGGE